MSSPVGGQGTAVQEPGFGTSLSNPPASATESPKSGCKDPIFAILFYVNIIAIVVVVIAYGPDAFSDTASFEYEGYIYASVITAVISFLASGVGLFVLMAIPESMIKISLIFVVAASGVWAVLAILSGSLLAAIMGLLFFAIGVCYARAVWSQ